MNASQRQSGFTLTELIITVAIIIILAAIAIPNYRGQVLRSNRSDAMAALMRVAAEQEKFYVQNNIYSSALDSDGLDVGDKSANEHYDLVIKAATINGFSAEATPVAGQADDKKCAVFSIDQRGQKLARSDDDEDTSDLCWR